MVNETPFTPPVHSLFAFREALKETLDEGIGNRVSHYNKISRLLRAGLKKLGLKLYLPEELFSNTMTSVYLPEGFTFQELHDTIKKRGFIIYDAQGQLKGKLFMLGVVGVITEQNIKDFLTVLGEVLNKKR
jgi:2-aminoethylphosphonate-pyruvate transaminase